MISFDSRMLYNDRLACSDDYNVVSGNLRKKRATHRLVCSGGFFAYLLLYLLL